jgi:signal transduction histidine kinase
VPACHLATGQVEQIVMNLVLNARDAMPSGGTVDVEIARSSLAGADHAWRDLVTIHVSDTGIGMPPHVRARMFEPYFTTKAVGKGAGLGLASVYGIVADAGGTIDVVTGIDQGTRVSVHLPRALPQWTA